MHLTFRPGEKITDQKHATVLAEAQLSLLLDEINRRADLVEALGTEKPDVRISLKMSEAGVFRHASLRGAPEILSVFQRAMMGLRGEAELKRSGLAAVLPLQVFPNDVDNDE